VGNNSLIGSSARISDRARILASVIGKECKIGAGTVIRDSYIFDGTSIGPECVIERSIVGTGVVMGEKSRVSRGCLIGDGVVLGPGSTLKPFERLSVKRSDHAKVEEGDEDSDLEEVEAREFFPFFFFFFLNKIIWEIVTRQIRITYLRHWETARMRLFGQGRGLLLVTMRMTSIAPKIQRTSVSCV